MCLQLKLDVQRVSLLEKDKKGRITAQNGPRSGFVSKCGGIDASGVYKREIYNPE